MGNRTSHDPRNRLEVGEDGGRRGWREIRLGKSDHNQLYVAEDGPFVDKKQRVVLFGRFSKRKPKSSVVVSLDGKQDDLQLIAQHPGSSTPSSYLLYFTYIYHPSTDQLIAFKHRDVHIYNMSTKKWSNAQSKLKVDLAPSSVCINDTVHIFGTDTFRVKKHKYLTYDVGKKSMVQGPISFDQRRASFEGCRAIFSSHLNKLLLIGGGAGAETPFSSELHEISHGRVDRTHHLPTPLSFFGCVEFKHFLLLFGGECAECEKTDLIYVFDLNEYQWRQSKIQLPSILRCHAVLRGGDVFVIEASGYPGAATYLKLSVLTILNGEVEGCILYRLQQLLLLVFL